MELFLAACTSKSQCFSSAVYFPPGNLREFQQGVSDITKATTVWFSFMTGRWQEALKLGHGGGILERAFVAKDHPRIKASSQIFANILMIFVHD